MHGLQAQPAAPGATPFAAPSVGAPPGAPARWLLLIHQVPTKPDYLRVKVRRRLQRLGAVALKNTVYTLPNTESTVEDFEWLLREIAAEGGEGIVYAAALLDGLTDADVEAIFRRDRDADYAEIAVAATRCASDPAGRRPVELARLRRRLDEVTRIDYFGAPGRIAAQAAVAAAEARLRPAPATAGEFGLGERPVGRTWVTRRGVGIDRIASGWLIRRFIDPAAVFKFVAPAGYRPASGELRFDMYDAEFTHEGTRCTFETLLARFGLGDTRGLGVLGAIVHDVDLKETAFGQPETAGVAALIDGIVATTPEDDTRLARGAALLDALYATFSARGSAAPGR